MANEVLQKQGLQFLFADATDFPNAGAGPPTTAANSLLIGAGTKVQIDCTALAAAGGARQSAQADLTTPWASQWALMACTEHATAPADGETVDFYWAPSTNSAAATGNTGATTGSDAAFTDSAGNLGQMQFIGSLILTTAVINIGFVGLLNPITQYGSLVVINQSAADLFAAAGNMDETHFVLNEIIDEIQ